jgi:predicted nucleic acid-binding protein
MIALDTNILARAIIDSDALHLAQAGHCGHLATFDARFRKLAKRLKLQPPVLAV